MKNLIAILILVTALGCSKNEYSQKIIGKWERVFPQSETMRYFNTYNNDNTGYNEWITTDTYIAKVQKNDYLKFDFNYKIDNDFLVYDENSFFKIILLNNNDLIIKFDHIIGKEIKPGVNDLATYQYKRMK